jgi:hypothetical protein
MSSWPGFRFRARQACLPPRQWPSGASSQNNGRFTFYSYCWQSGVTLRWAIAVEADQLEAKVQSKKWVCPGCASPARCTNSILSRDVFKAC